MNSVERSRASRMAAARILALRSADGALALGGTPGGSRRLVPYFANLAALGLVVAAWTEPDAGEKRRWIDAARHWTRWYDAHRNLDGTIFDYEGTPGAWKATGKYDSTDS